MNVGQVDKFLLIIKAESDHFRSNAVTSVCKYKYQKDNSIINNNII